MPFATASRIPAAKIESLRLEAPTIQTSPKSHPFTLLKKSAALVRVMLFASRRPPVSCSVASKPGREVGSGLLLAASEYDEIMRLGLFK